MNQQLHGSRDRGRPTYPTSAAEWLVGADQRTVLELNAGSGRFTEALVSLGHDVHATDPSPALLETLADRLPDVRTNVSSAEFLPALDASVDVVVCADGFERFDAAKALPEIARVLRTGGWLAVAWAEHDTSIPWVRRLGKLIGEPPPVATPQGLVMSTQFGFVEESSFRFWQSVDASTLCDLALSRPELAALDEQRRDLKLAEVRAFYDDYGRGADGMQLPWMARCFKAAVVEHPWSVPPREDPAGHGEQPPAPRPPDDGDSLLIDFR